MSSTRFMLLTVVLLISTILLPIQVSAAPLGTLDQQQTAINGAAVLSSSPPESSPLFLGQTFTAGLTGSLTEVDLAVACQIGSRSVTCALYGNVTVEIHAGNTTGTLLGSSSLAPSAITVIAGGNPSVFVPFTFSSPQSSLETFTR